MSLTPQRLVPGALVLLSASCIYDADDRCSPGETFDEGLMMCRCPEGTGEALRSDIVVVGTPDHAWPRTGCRACFFNETLEPGTVTCSCNADSVFLPNGYCAPTYGTACTADAQCAQILLASGAFGTGLCQPVSAEGGFCTTECTAHADCAPASGLFRAPGLGRCSAIPCVPTSTTGMGTELCMAIAADAECASTGLCVLGGGQ